MQSHSLPATPEAEQRVQCHVLDKPEALKASWMLRCAPGSPLRAQEGNNAEPGEACAWLASCMLWLLGRGCVPLQANPCEGQAKGQGQYCEVELDPSSTWSRFLMSWEGEL